MRFKGIIKESFNHGSQEARKDTEKGYGKGSLNPG